MQAGRLLASGTHQELLDTNEVYVDIVTSQLREDTAQEPGIGNQESEVENPSGSPPQSPTPHSALPTPHSKVVRP
jgi:hypothetical protein